MKCVKRMGLLAAVLAFGSVLAVPVVDNVRVSSRAGSMDVLYDLSDVAVVTMDVLTNGVSIGARNFTTVKGAVNRRVEAGTDCRIRWRPHREWPGEDLSGVTVKLTAWTTNAPPDYLVYDFVSHTTNFYSCVEAFPDGGLANDVYRTDRIVLRKIPAKGVEWTMGCFSEDVGSTANALAHKVVLTEDYYMAIYETTQAQHIHSGSSYPSSFTYRGEDAAVHPADTVHYWHVHGDWPTKGRKDPGGAVSNFRKKSGIDFDLPTEAQWEYACRAGTQTMINTGFALTNTTSDANMNAAAWSNANSAEGYETYSSHPVGTRLPNAWGLYDMHGNMQEWCLDYYAAVGADAADPIGPDSGDYRCLRGGGYRYADAGGCVSSRRDRDYKAVQDRGFRMICPVSLKW